MTLDQINGSIVVMDRVCRNLKCHYFLCFGSLLGLIRDGGLLKIADGREKDREDVDFGIFYEDMDEKQIAGGFKKFGYQLVKVVRNDYESGRKPFYMKLTKSTGENVDIFAWYYHKGIRYHTFDCLAENKDIPSKYIFRGVPEQWLMDKIDWQNKVKPRLVDFPVLRTQVKIPVNFGHCLDEWYPNWLKPQQGMSQSQWYEEMDSCKGWRK